jgi:hypothetical protein
MIEPGELYAVLASAGGGQAEDFTTCSPRRPAHDAHLDATSRLHRVLRLLRADLAAAPGRVIDAEQTPQNQH